MNTRVAWCTTEKNLWGPPPGWGGEGVFTLHSSISSHISHSKFNFHENFPFGANISLNCSWETTDVHALLFPKPPRPWYFDVSLTSLFQALGSWESEKAGKGGKKRGEKKASLLYERLCMHGRFHCVTQFHMTAVWNMLWPHVPNVTKHIKT